MRHPALPLCSQHDVPGQLFLYLHAQRRHSAAVAQRVPVPKTGYEDIVLVEVEIGADMQLPVRSSPFDGCESYSVCVSDTIVAFGEADEVTGVEFGYSLGINLADPYSSSFNSSTP